MGAFLDKPKTEKEGSCGTGNGLRYGLSSMQGWRVEMEDAHCAVVGLPHGLDEWSFFAVFDGHAGARVSAHCAQNLLDSIIQFDEFVAGAATSDATDDQMEKVKTGIRNGFLQACINFLFDVMSPVSFLFLAASFPVRPFPGSIWLNFRSRSPNH